MKVCENCGYQSLDDSATVCDSCGGKLKKEEYKNPKVYQPERNNYGYNRYDRTASQNNDYNEGYRQAQRDYHYNKSASNDYGGCGWMLLGFLLSPLLALVLYLVFKDNYPNRARDIGKGAIIGVVFCVVVYLFVSCGLIALLSNNSHYYR